MSTRAAWDVCPLQPATTTLRPPSPMAAARTPRACCSTATATVVNDADQDGICDEQETLGCDDAAACNYNALATDNDGSCDFASCLGCTVPSACNYDAAATQNDGSCDLSSCLGCTYGDALNYDATATQDNGSCLFDLSGGGGDCVADFNGDGAVGAADLLEFLILYDTFCE